MFSTEKGTPSPIKMEVCKELRMDHADEERIRIAAIATGLQESDFIRQAALMRAQAIEQRTSLSVLPTEVFEEFQAAIEDPGQIALGLARAAEASKGLLKDVG